MKKSDVSRSIWALFESAKDAAIASLVQGVASGQLKIDRAALPLASALVRDAFDQTFSRGFKSVEKSLETTWVHDELPRFPASKSGVKTKKN